MSKLTTALTVLLLAVAALAQDPPRPAPEQAATVEMVDGRVLKGTIVAVEIGTMKLRVDGEVLSLSTSDIHSCKTETEVAPAPPPAAAGTPAKATEPSAGEAKPAAPPTSKPARRAQRPAPPSDEAARPTGRLALFQNRLDALGQVYPWLVPAAATQWLSFGLLLFATLSLLVHLSALVVAGQGQAFGRSMLVALWYMMTGLLQVAMVPAVDFANFVMLIANPAVALFWMRQLFGLSRGAAVIALAVQLGFCLLGYGVLEVVSSLLGSIEPHPV